MTAGTRYSFGGNIKKPRQLLPGGYISFVDPQKDEFEQILFLGETPELHTLGSANGQRSLRVFVDGKTREKVRGSRKPNQTLTQSNRQHREILEAGALKRATLY